MKAEQRLPHPDLGRQNLCFSSGRQRISENLHREIGAIGVERVFGDVAAAQVQLECRNRYRLTGGKSELMTRLAMGNDQDEVSVGCRQGPPAQGAARDEADLTSHGMIERIDADRFDIDLDQLFPALAHSKFPLLRSFGYPELMEQSEISDGGSNQYRCNHGPPHAPSYRPAISDAGSASHTATHWPAACCARPSISRSVNVLSGWSMTTGASSCMPSASRCTSASCRNSFVMITAVGRPAASSAMPSCIRLQRVNGPGSTPDIAPSATARGAHRRQRDR